MTALEVMDAVKEAGGLLVLNGNRIKYTIPKAATWLVTELRNQREEVSELLRERAVPSQMPPGVRLLKWKPKAPPIAIIHMGIVTDVDKFVAATLLQLKARLEGKDFLAGNWSLRQIVDRLEQVGLLVKVESTPSVGRRDEQNH
jgi:hypothetical protein